LVERLSDRESLIRAHAVIALSKLVGSEDPNEVEPGEQTILEILLDVLCYDPAACVRYVPILAMIYPCLSTEKSGEPPYCRFP
jgi:condensin complex subunit 3